ncbi:MAG: hypothetical protein RMH97_04820 [Verrucomicrobiales bacterium]|nr:hypothetical protein [Verrucomicrobiales bacterium]
MSLFDQPLAAPAEPVTLTPKQIEQLNSKLSAMRHDIANHLTVIVTAAEMAANTSEKARHHLSLLFQQVPRIKDAVNAFTTEFETVFGIRRS